MTAAVMLDLPGRVLVVGAGGGIGGAVAEKLRAAGSEVLGADRSPRPEGWPGPWTTADISSAEDRAKIARMAEGPLDGVVYAAGILDPAGWEEIGEDEAARVLSVNLLAPFFLLRELRPCLAEGAGVVLIGSISGLRASPATPIYAASKAGLRNLAASLAILLQPRGARVNHLAPGLIDTPLTAALNREIAARGGVDVARVEQQRAEAIPMGRAGTVEEVAATTLFLLSSQSSYLTGASLFPTGGVLAGMI